MHFNHALSTVIILDEEIDKEGFLLLTNDVLQSVIPKAGPRAIFLNKLEQLKVNNF